MGNWNNLFTILLSQEQPKKKHGKKKKKSKKKQTLPNWQKADVNSSINNNDCDLENTEPVTESVEPDRLQIIDNSLSTASSIKLATSNNSSNIEPKEDNQSLPSRYTIGQQSVPIEFSNIDGNVQQDDNVADIVDGGEATANDQTAISSDRSTNTVQVISGSKKKKKSNSKKYCSNAG